MPSLHQLSRWAHVDKFKRKITKEKDKIKLLKKLKKNGRTILHESCRSFNGLMVSCVLNTIYDFVNKNNEKMSEIVNTTDKYGCIPIHYICLWKDINEIKIAIKELIKFKSNTWQLQPIEIAISNNLQCGFGYCPIDKLCKGIHTDEYYDDYSKFEGIINILSKQPIIYNLIMDDFDINNCKHKRFIIRMLRMDFPILNYRIYKYIKNIKIRKRILNYFIYCNCSKSICYFLWNNINLFNKNWFNQITNFTETFHASDDLKLYDFLHKDILFISSNKNIFKKWTTKTHNEFPTNYKNCILTILLILKKTTNNNIKNNIQFLYMITSYFMANFFNDNNLFIKYITSF